MGTNKKYWKGFDELNQTPEFLENAQKEFPQELSVDQFLAEDKVAEASTGRRDFLKFLGFSVAAATLAACEAPVIKATPYVVKPEEVTPGVANWYASTYYDGAHYASILVKSREGRPIMIKGNCDYGFTKGATNPQIIASVLSLYNGDRLAEPLANREQASWGDVDAGVVKGLNKAVKKGKRVVLLSGSEISPSTLDIIDKFKTKYGGESSEDAVLADGEEARPSVDSKVSHIQYDAVSYNGIREANLESFGQAIIPDYDFREAKVIVSIGADFLNSWVLSTQFVNQYLLKRNPDGDWMSRHFQFESNMSQTGSNADVRGLIKPSEQGRALAFLHKEITGKALPGVDLTTLREDTTAKLKMAAKELKAQKGHSLLICGSNRKSLQLITNSINSYLKNYDRVINLNNPINLYQSQDTKLAELIQDMNQGKIGALIMWNTNPIYTLSNSEQFKEALSKVDLTVAMSQFEDETASLCDYVCPVTHSLESWNDFSAKQSEYAIAQPTIRPLFNSRAAAESLLIFSGHAVHSGKDSLTYHNYIKEFAQVNYLKTPSNYSSFESYWNSLVHQSTHSTGDLSPAASEFAFNGDLKAASKDIASITTGLFELSLYEKAGIGNGSQAGNPWLQELPDPITKVTWDNYVTMSYEDMKRLGCETGLGQETPSTVVNVSVGDREVELPAYAQAGQMPGTIGIALGYGRGANGEKIGKSAYHQNGHYGEAGTDPIGKNGFIFVDSGDYSAYNVEIKKSEKVYNLACTQTHSTVMARNSIVKETTLDIYKTQSKGAYNHQHTLHMGWDHEESPVGEFDLWEEHPVEHVGHRWGMSIDLNTCIGCGSCVIACHAENNVPVVGKDEVRRGREMHWLRLDRYYASDIEPTVGTRDPEKFAQEGFPGLENPAENPKVVHMPMMCQHCNHAPCETVCPVAATTHSNEGLNQMAYNRCIGTRYCANNCPYKVRRFNWFNYPSYRKFVEVNPAQDDLGRMVLNPDVVVRTRGVMEKCSFCIQEIQAAKLKAKKADRMLKDGDVDCACAGACPTNAIKFGDWNDENSAVRKDTEDDRSYQVLEEIGVKPNVWYKVKVRNESNEALAALQVDHGHGHQDEHGHGNENGHEDEQGHGHDSHGAH